MALSAVPNRSHRIYILGGYDGSGIKGADKQQDTAGKLEFWISSTLKSTWRVGKGDTFFCDSARKVQNIISSLNFEPSHGDTWFVDVDVDALGSANSKALLKTANSIGNSLPVVWFFKVHYSKGKRGFPIYQSLLKENAQSVGIWGTYLRSSDIEWYLKDCLRIFIDRLIATGNEVQKDVEKQISKIAINKFISWVGNSYNRDIDKVFSVGDTLKSIGAKGVGLTVSPTSYTKARSYVINEIGLSSSSVESWVLQVIEQPHVRAERNAKIAIAKSNPVKLRKDGKPYKKRGYELVTVKTIPQASHLAEIYGYSRLYGVVKSVIDGLIEVKMHMLMGEGFKGHWGDKGWSSDDVRRYTKYWYALIDGKPRFGKVRRGIRLEELIHAKEALGEYRWGSELDVFNWVYSV